MNAIYNDKCHSLWYFVHMSVKTKIDRAGRLVIPKELRERYGFDEGAEVEIVAVPDGITLVPVRTERRVVRRGRVVAMDTGAEPAALDAFEVDRVRGERLDRAGGVLE